MMLLQCLCPSFYSLQSLVNFARRRRTLSAITKKPAAMASFLGLGLCSLASLRFSSTHLTFHYPPRSSQLSIQIPNCPNPA
jgi:hypothetical protein